MMNTLEDRLRSGLATEAEAWREPSTVAAASPSAARWSTSVALTAMAAAVVMLVGGVALFAQVGDDADPTGTSTESTPPVTSVVANTEPAPEWGAVVAKGLALAGFDLEVDTAYRDLFADEIQETLPSKHLLTAVVRDAATDELLITIGYESFADGDEADGWPSTAGLSSGEETSSGTLFTTEYTGRQALFLVKPTGVVSVHIEDEGFAAETSAESLRTLTLFLAANVDTDGLADTVFGGPFEAVPFSGETWQFNVGEDASPPTTTYKVCFRFDGPGVTTEASAIRSGCGDWDPNVVHAEGESYIGSVGPALATESGTVLLIDLKVAPVHNVRIIRDNGDVIDVAPFRMPSSGKQFAVVEVPGRTGSVAVELTNEAGEVLQRVDSVSLAASTTDPAEGSPLTLHVSNQSLSEPTVDIAVEIDGELVIDDTFDVGSQHNWVEFQFDLAPGDYEIVARSDTDAVFKWRIEILDGQPLYAVLDYWGQSDMGEDGAGTPGFEFQISAEPIAFR